MRETTALGAAIAAGFAVGVWKSFDELKEINKEERFVFKPKISQRASDKMYNKWNKAVTMSKGWTTEEDDENESEAGDHPDDEVLEQTVTKDEYGRSRDD